jgi:hypothetical protein
MGLEDSEPLVAERGGNEIHDVRLIVDDEQADLALTSGHVHIITGASVSFLWIESNSHGGLTRSFAVISQTRGVAFCAIEPTEACKQDVEAI